jgi:hypothetical protein
MTGDEGGPAVMIDGQAPLETVRRTHDLDEVAMRCEGTRGRGRAPTPRVMTQNGRFNAYFTGPRQVAV